MTDEEVRQEYESLLYREKCTFDELLLRRSQLSASRAEVKQYREALTMVAEYACQPEMCPGCDHECVEVARAALADSENRGTGPVDHGPEGEGRPSPEAPKDGGPAGVDRPVAPSISLPSPEASPRPWRVDAETVSEPGRRQILDARGYAILAEPMREPNACLIVEAVNAYGMCRAEFPPDGRWAAWVECTLQKGHDGEHAAPLAVPTLTREQVEAALEKGAKSARERHAKTGATFSMPNPDIRFDSPQAPPAWPKAPAPSPETPPGDALAELERMALDATGINRAVMLAALSRAREAHAKALKEEWSRARTATWQAVSIWLDRNGRTEAANALSGPNAITDVWALSRRPESAG